MVLFKIRKKTVFDDFKTGITSKFFLFIGLLIIGVYIILKTIAAVVTIEETESLLYILIHSYYLESIFALSIIFIGIGVILYFIHLQFAKLAKITKELERESNEKKKKK